MEPLAGRHGQDSGRPNSGRDRQGRDEEHEAKFLFECHRSEDRESVMDLPNNNAGEALAVLGLCRTNTSW